MSILDMWPLYGPPRRDGERLNDRDCLTTPKETLYGFVGAIYPKLGLPGGSWLVFFLRYIWPEYGSRNREWVEKLDIPTELWPFVSHAGQGGVRFVLTDVPSQLLPLAISWAGRTPHIVCNDFNYPGAQVRFRVAVMDGKHVMYYLGDTVMTTAARQAMLCNDCLTRGLPGYLVFGNSVGPCACGQPVAPKTECHRCGAQYCFVCAQKRNCADWTVWPPRPFPT